MGGGGAGGKENRVNDIRDSFSPTHIHITHSSNSTAHLLTILSVAAVRLAAACTFNIETFTFGGVLEITGRLACDFNPQFCRGLVVRAHHFVTCSER